MLNFPNTPADGDISDQPNGVRYQWDATLTRWDVVGVTAAGVATLVGAVQAFAYAVVDPLWLRCDGSEVSRTDFAALFTAIGVTYGDGDASTTFNLPDYRGNFLRDQDEGAAVDPDRASRTDRGDGTTGDEIGTKQGHQFASHSHTQTVIASSSDTQNGSANRARAGSVQTAAAGGNETRPINTYVQHYIHA